jgi:hypothetical protein
LLLLQGLAPHHDDVELWVVQTHGSKSWKLYKPINGYQLPNQPSGDLDQVRGNTAALPTSAQQQCGALAGGSAAAAAAAVIASCCMLHAPCCERSLPLPAGFQQCGAGAAELLWFPLVMSSCGPAAADTSAACCCLQESLGDPVLEVELCVGDVLYMPRGTVHQATAQTADSSHLTISTYQRCSYADLAIHLLQVSKATP